MEQILDWLREKNKKLKDESVNGQRKAQANNEVENYYYEMGKAWAYYNTLENIDEAEEKYLEQKSKWEADSTCNGCKYENDASEECECGHCKRAFSDCYEPKKISEVE